MSGAEIVVEGIDFQDELRTAVQTAGGAEAFAETVKIPLRAVWDAMGEREPHPRILLHLGLAQLIVTVRSKT